MKKYFYIAIALFTLASCAVKYQQQDLPKEELVRGADPADTPSTSLP